MTLLQALSLPRTQVLQCGQIWGGIENNDADLESEGLVASLYARAASGERGGDIHYLSVCKKNALTRLAIADVVGHGEQAAEQSAWLYAGMQRYLNRRANHRILRSLSKHVYARGLRALSTAGILSYLRPFRRLYYSLAGHPAPLVLRRSTGAGWQSVDQIKPPSGARLPLGARKRIPYRQRSLRMDRGDRVFLFTDGVVELPETERGSRAFGLKRLLEILNHEIDAPPADVKSTVRAELERFHKGPAHDDMTFLIAEIR